MATNPERFFGDRQLRGLDCVCCFCTTSACRRQSSSSFDFWTQVFRGFPFAWLAIPAHTYGIHWTGFFIGLKSFVWGLMMAQVVRSFYRILDEPGQDTVHECDEMQIP